MHYTAALKWLTLALLVIGMLLHVVAQNICIANLQSIMKKPYISKVLLGGLVQSSYKNYQYDIVKH